MKLNTLIFLLFVGSVANAQIIKPAKFSTSPSIKKAKVGDVVTLTFSGTIDPKWKLYSTDNTLDPGPVAAEVKFKTNDSYQLVGKLTSVKPEVHKDDVWGGNVSFFVGKATFTQKVKVLKAKPTIEGKLKYQTCTISDGACVLGNDNFKVTL
jgi:hypothetical protein